MNRKRLVLATIALLMVTVLPAAATVWQVQVSDFTFNPAHIVIAEGDTVVWTNVQGFHNVQHTANPPLFGNQVAAAPWTYSYVFGTPGIYEYICEIHPSTMIGTVTVQGPSAAPGRPEPVNAIQLEQNYPNPFNNQTAIVFSLPNQSMARLSVLNILGQTVAEVHNGELNSGTHRVIFDASGLSSGVYYYRLETPQATFARKMALIK